jgi:hypothetical protein
MQEANGAGLAGNPQTWQKVDDILKRPVRVVPRGQIKTLDGAHVPLAPSRVQAKLLAFAVGILAVGESRVGLLNRKVVHVELREDGDISCRQAEKLGAA